MPRKTKFSVENKASSTKVKVNGKAIKASKIEIDSEFDEIDSTNQSQNFLKQKRSRSILKKEKKFAKDKTTPSNITNEKKKNNKNKNLGKISNDSINILKSKRVKKTVLSEHISLSDDSSHEISEATKIEETPTIKFNTEKTLKKRGRPKRNKNILMEDLEKVNNLAEINFSPSENKQKKQKSKKNKQIKFSTNKDNSSINLEEALTENNNQFQEGKEKETANLNENSICLNIKNEKNSYAKINTNALSSNSINFSENDVCLTENENNPENFINAEINENCIYPIVPGSFEFDVPLEIMDSKVDENDEIVLLMAWKHRYNGELPVTSIFKMEEIQKKCPDLLMKFLISKINKKSC